MPKNSEREGQSRILVYAPHLKKLDTAAGTERTVNKDNVWKPTTEGKIDDYFVNKRSNLIKGAGRFGTNGNCLFKPEKKLKMCLDQFLFWQIFDAAIKYLSLDNETCAPTLQLGKSVNNSFSINKRVSVQEMYYSFHHKLW